MKSLFIKIGSGIALLSLLSVSCNKKIDEAFANPNAPSEGAKVPVEQLLPNMIASMAANAAAAGPLNDTRFIGGYIQYWHNSAFSTVANTQSQFDRMGGTNGSSDIAGSIWRQHYYDFGFNMINMIQWAEEQKKWDYAGVGKAMFAWSWLQVTDYHGEVILNEAFRRDQLTFKFDSEELVYPFVRKLCFEALDYLNRTGDGVSQANLAKGDAFLYNGDVNKWKKFVNAILARSYHHLSNKSNYQADSVIYYCDRALTSNDDNANVRFAATGISANSNFFGPLRGNIGGLRQGAYIADLMSGRNPVFPVSDPRAWYILKRNLNNTFIGVRPTGGIIGIPDANNRPLNFWGGPSNISTSPAGGDTGCTYVFRNAGPMPVITAAEIAFMKAEAAYRKGDRTTALNSYRDGIRLNFDMLTTQFSTNVPVARTITPEMRDAFLADPNVVPSAANLTLSHIMLQKYIALYGYGVMETWVDMRRYHYTDQEAGQQVYRNFAPPSGADLFPDNNGKLVYRVRYRFNSEYVWNLDELRRLGADAVDWHTKETWFSKP